MAPTTAMCFVLSGVALLLGSVQVRKQTAVDVQGNSVGSFQGGQLSSISKTMLLGDFREK